MNLPGYDEWLEAPYMRQDRNPEVDEDEGALILQSAMDYLGPRASADEDEQLVGDFEAWCVLQTALEDVHCEYQCHFCGEPLARRRDRYCSKACYIADREGY